MSTDEKRVILLEIVDKLNKAESWSGETHIQKAVYFLANMTPVDLGFSFVLYKFGPFSFDLRGELQFLESLGVLKREESEPFGSHFSLGKNSAAFKAFVGINSADAEKHIDWTVQTFLVKGRKVAQLERDATALYALKNFQGAEPEQAEAIHKVKPHISKEDAMEAIRRVHELLLESSNR